MHFATMSYCIRPFQLALALLFVSCVVLLVPSTSMVLSDSPNPYWYGVQRDFLSWLQYVKQRVASEPQDSRFHKTFQPATILTVDLNGKGNFTSIQKAIDSIPNPNKKRFIIKLNAGIYREKIEIPRNKSSITLQGQGRNNTIIVWNATASDANSTFESATFAVDSQYFIAFNVTFQNSAPAQAPGAIQKQAVAIRVSGDNAAFYGCGFLAHQDTLYDQKGYHYFKDCFIEGSIDFIFGNGLSLYKNCELHVVPLTPGALTAQKRARNDSDTGFAFLYCRITGTGIVYLGRAWGRYSRVVFLYTYMADIILPEGWNNWGDARKNETVYYGQYKCSGPGAAELLRVPWCHELTDQEAQPFLSLDFIDGISWVPEP